MLGNVVVGLASIAPPNKVYFQPWFLELWGEAIAANLNLNVIQQSRCLYPPASYTQITFLAESHLSLETYPENNRIELMISSCKPFTKEQFEKAIGLSKRFVKLSKLLKRTKKGWV